MAVKLRIFALDYHHGNINIGHASLEISGTNGYRYLSVWPSGRWDNKGQAFTKEEDFANENGEAFYQNIFHNLHEDKMMAWWDKLIKANTLTYSNTFYGFNCMTNAALFLNVGKGYDPIEDAWRIVTIQEHWSLMWFATGMKAAGW